MSNNITTATTTASAIKEAVPSLRKANINSAFAEAVLAVTREESPEPFTKASFASHGADLEAYRRKVEAIYDPVMALMAAREKGDKEALMAAFAAAKTATNAFWYQFGTRPAAKAGGSPRPLFSFTEADLAHWGEDAAECRNLAAAQSIAGGADSIALADLWVTYVTRTAGRVLRGKPMERPTLENTIALRKRKQAEAGEKSKATKAANKAAKEAEAAAQEKRIAEANARARKAEETLRRMEESAVNVGMLTALINESAATPAQKAEMLAVCTGDVKTPEELAAFRKSQAGGKSRAAK